MEKHSSFTLLVGITLSDCLTDYAGNFTAYAGSHNTVISDMRDIVASGRPPSTITHGEKRAFGNVRQVHARRGDVVFAHHKLAHRGGANHSANIRYQIYFRLTHVVCGGVGGRGRQWRWEAGHHDARTGARPSPLAPRPRSSPRPVLTADVLLARVVPDRSTSGCSTPALRTSMLNLTACGRRCRTLCRPRLRQSRRRTMAPHRFRLPACRRRLHSPRQRAGQSSARHSWSSS